MAALARRMHDAGAHHQDFYLNHILWRGEAADLDLRVIDLGRVGFAKELSRRWILKDLAQLDFSARQLSCTERLRFLRLYLGRPFCRADRRLVQRIARKSRRIAAHTSKHGL
jgi:heptose I phosphotransferase